MAKTIHQKGDIEPRPTSIQNIFRTLVGTSDTRTDIAIRTPIVATTVDCHGNQMAAMFFLCFIFSSFNIMK